MKTIMTMTRLPLLLPLLLAGCVTLTPSQRGALEEVMAFTAATVEAYGARPLAVRLADEPSAAAYRWRVNTATGELVDAAISLHPGVLGLPPHLGVALVAHELGHHLLGHHLLGHHGTITESEYLRLELEADTKAVEILMKVRGLSEVTALQRMHELHRENGSCATATGLLRRFPQHRATTASWDCAPAECRPGVPGACSGRAHPAAPRWRSPWPRRTRPETPSRLRASSLRI